ncbi:MAG: hypothetical protein WCP46_08960 [Alphaproteobacteria bacterium]|jgi:hypothetical protein
MSLYRGGMGSFNDIVIQKDEKALIKENDEFHALKHALYEKFIELTTSQKA